MQKQLNVINTFIHKKKNNNNGKFSLILKYDHKLRQVE